MSGWLALLKRWIPRRWRRSERLRELVDAKRDGRVLAGSFAGLRYLDESYGSELRPKLLGTYELEIREALEVALARGPRVVVVVGAAEGYYAVGLAYRLPSAHVVAFEARPEARRALAELARLNEVAARVEIRESCDIPTLRATLTGEGPFLLVVDIDGAEAILLDPRVVPGLERAEILVETHDCFVPGTSAALRERFAGSHDMQWYPQRPRSSADVPQVVVPDTLRGALQLWLAERRPDGNDWLHLWPR